MATFLARMKRKRQRNDDQEFLDPEELHAPPGAKKKRRSSSQDARSPEVNGKVAAISDSWTLENVCKAAGRNMRLVSNCVRSPVNSSCKVLAFREWCNEVGIKLHPELSIGRSGSCADIGVIALADIQEGEEVAVIPRTSLLNSTNSCLQLDKQVKHDQEFRKQLPHLNSWVPLLLALMAEYRLKSESKWFPYLALVPNNEEAGSALPLLWSECERERLLSGTGVRERVDGDLVKIETDFQTVVLPFMRRHPDLFRKTFHSLELYKKLVSFVMSYSFTDPVEEDVLQRTMMVPFVDLLNHHSDHHVELNYHQDHLQLLAVRDIRKGEEVMNTYGPLPNSSLLHVYGFTESENPNNVTFITRDALQEIYLQDRAIQSKRKERWAELVRESLVEDKYEVNCNGDPEHSLCVLVKVLHARSKHYQAMKKELLACCSDTEESSGSEEEEEREGEEKEEGEEEEGKVEELNFTADYNLSCKEVAFLRQVVEKCLEHFPESYESSVKTAKSDHLLIPREKHALHLCIGQQKCLLALLGHLP